MQTNVPKAVPLGRGWRLYAGPAPVTLIGDFIRPAVRAVPAAMAREIGCCRVAVAESLGGPSVASRWTATEAGLEISLAAAGREEHNVALELLLCLGQSLWINLSPRRAREYWLLLDREIAAGIPGEIDEDALEQKRLLLTNRSSAGSRTRLARYGAASFAGTVAEYIHSLWHDVTIRAGPDFLPALQLRRRLDLLSRWYPPARGRRLYPGASHRT